MRVLLRLFVAGLTLILAGAVRGETLYQPPGLIRALITVSVAPEGRPAKLDALLTRPAAPGRYPLIVLSHGAPRDVLELPTTHPTTSSAVAIEFARRGWVVIAPMRRGYGRSDGPYVENTGSCKSPDYPGAGRHAAADLIETIKFMARQDYVDPTRVMLAGVSAGGFSSIAAAAQHPPNLLAVLNFAGGRGSTGPDAVCGADLLVRTYGEFGHTVRVPTLWVYAANDHFFGPALAKRFFAAFTGSGGTGEFVALPAFGSDGHFLFTDVGIPLWRDRVDVFLRQHNLPTWSKPAIEAAPHLPPPAALSASSRQEFTRYLASANFEKAFAVSRKGFLGWVTGRPGADEAAAAALARCKTRAPDCKLYAVNDRLVH